MLTVRGFLMGMFFVTKILADDDKSQSCINLLESENYDCCESLKIFKSLDEAADECNKNDSKDMNCDDYKCILDKRGLMNGDNLDEEAAKAFFSAIGDTYPEEKNVIKKIEAACYSEKYKKYDLTDENCPMLNFYVCAYVNALLECNSWKSSPDCKNLSEDANICKIQLAKS